MARDLAIEIEGLGKAYRHYASPWHKATELFTLGNARLAREHWALCAVTASVEQGSALGIVGANGSGKSTLLKLLARTTPPSAGRFRVRGRTASLLELGAGFHPSFTGRENVALAAQLAGLSRRELARLEGAILDFAELGPAIDEPLRTYSTGMGMRLGFAVATAIEPDVLLLDEVLAVGDLSFQKKCVDRILALAARGAAIVFASHSLYDVRQLCERALWLEQGRVAALGDSATVTHDYAAFQREHVEHDALLRARTERDRVARPRQLPSIAAASLHRAATQEPTWEIDSGDDLDVRVDWRNPTTRPVHLGVAFLRHDRTLVAACGTHLDGVELRGAEGTCTLHCPALPLLAGSFLVLVILFDEVGVHRHQELVLERNLVVRAHAREVGLVSIEHAWSVEAPLAARECA